MTGAGYAITTADDYIKWMRAWLKPDSGPLSENVIKELWTPRSIVDLSDHDVDPFVGVPVYALGWFVNMYRGHLVYWHTGGIFGAGSLIVLVPDLDFGISFFANILDAASKFRGVALDLLDEALGVPEQDRITIKTLESGIVARYQKMAKEVRGPFSLAFPVCADFKFLCMAVRQCTRPSISRRSFEAYCAVGSSH